MPINISYSKSSANYAYKAANGLNNTGNNFAG
jgi:hypothetical protein